MSNNAVQLNRGTTYEIMHTESVVARISTNGVAQVLHEQFMPFDLMFELEDDIDTRLNNLSVFYHWCASRVLSIDRKYAKEIMNSIGMAQSTTDQYRAKISLSYHCVSLTDVYWVREQGERVTFAQLNLYDNSLNEAIVPLPLKGKMMTVTNEELAQDLSTKGFFPKAWIRRDETFYLLKDGDRGFVEKELLASEICQCFAVPQVIYRPYEYDGELVTASELVTSKQYSIASKMAYEVYCINRDMDVIEECIRLDPITYYGMNIVDYLTGNTDRHPENWGVLVNNETNQPMSLYPLMDFNQCFLAYDTIEGASCMTTATRMNQMEAAIDGVKHIGLRQIKDMDMSKFRNLTAEAAMFRRRLDILKEYE